MRHWQRKSLRVFHLKIKNSVYQCLLANCVVSHNISVPCVMRVTILAYTNSRLETGVQPAKSHMSSFSTLLKTTRVVSERINLKTLDIFVCFKDNKDIFQSLVSHPTMKPYRPFGIQYENMQLTNHDVT